MDSRIGPVLTSQKDSTENQKLNPFPGIRLLHLSFEVMHFICMDIFINCIYMTASFICKSQCIFFTFLPKLIFLLK